MTRVLSAAAVAALLVAGAAGAVRADTRHRSRPDAQGHAVASTSRRIDVAAELERQTALAINDVRREHGLVPLRLSSALVSAARGHSLSMAEHGYFRHESWDGSVFWKRIRPGYPPLPGRYWATGENLVWASPRLSAKAAVGMWLKRPAHRKNLLSAAWREVGLGGVRAIAAPGVYEGLDVTILTADFGVR
jgi:uncharacterized protein YkwD